MKPKTCRYVCGDCGVEWTQIYPSTCDECPDCESNDITEMDAT